MASAPKKPLEQVPVDELTYEQAFAELEAIVAALEDDPDSLDQTLILFERGQCLARYCAKMLDQAELKVMQLSGDALIDYTD